jgi:hypothetical protein
VPVRTLLPLVLLLLASCRLALSRMQLIDHCLHSTPPSVFLAGTH